MIKSSIERLMVKIKFKHDSIERDVKKKILKKSINSRVRTIKPLVIARTLITLTGKIKKKDRKPTGFKLSRLKRRGNVRSLDKSV